MGHPKKMSAKTKIIPNCSKKTCVRIGKNGVKIFEPSNGGIGIRLNIASTMLSCIRDKKHDVVCGVFLLIMPNAKNALYKSPKRIASAMLLKGPAAATFKESFLGFFKL